jgi:hypothetical protein
MEDAVGTLDGNRPPDMQASQSIITWAALSQTQTVRQLRRGPEL